jgi:hypothetical protein
MVARGTWLVTVWRDVRWYRDQRRQAERVPGRSPHVDMAAMDGIEGPAKDTDTPVGQLRQVQTPPYGSRAAPRRLREAGARLDR